jgi:nucleoside-diphosphate-sugar epimerase
MEKVLVTGSAGFIGGYLVDELLKQGYSVIGLDNLSKYGRISRSFDENSNYNFVQGDAADVALLEKLLVDCDHFIAGAALIGGISYFHQFAYDLLSKNERIIAAACDAAIATQKAGRPLKRLPTYLVLWSLRAPTVGQAWKVMSVKFHPHFRVTGFKSLQLNTLR